MNKAALLMRFPQNMIQRGTEKYVPQSSMSSLPQFRPQTPTQKKEVRPGGPLFFLSWSSLK